VHYIHIGYLIRGAIEVQGFDDVSFEQKEYLSYI
jgi:hypothetical protein